MFTYKLIFVTLELADATKLIRLVFAVLLQLLLQTLQLLLRVRRARGKSRTTQVLLKVVFSLAIATHHAGDLFGELK